MSIFNPSDYNNTNNDLETSILSKITTIYLKKDGGTDTSITQTNFSNDLSINGNIIADSKTITPIELSYLDNVTSNIQTQINSSGGSPFFQILYVAGQFGNDANTGHSPNKPKKTIMAALNDAGANSGIVICIFPWNYTAETITISRLNVTITAFSVDKSALVSLGQVSIIGASSSVRLQSLSINGINHTGACNLYIDYCKIYSFGKSSNSYVEIQNTNIITSFYWDCNAIINLLNNNMPCFFSNTANCATSQVNISNNLVVGYFVLLSGVVGINNSPLYAQNTNNFAIAAQNSAIYLTDCSILNPDNTPGKIQLTNCLYSINNTTYNNTLSGFAGSTKIIRNVFNDSLTTNLTTDSTAITQNSSDNSTKIATTAFVKLFTPNKTYKGVRFAPPYLFTFGTDNQFFFSFQSSNGVASNDFYLAVSNNIIYSYDITLNSSLIYNVFNGSSYYTSSTSVIHNYSINYLKASSGTLLTSTDGRGVKGDFYDWSNSVYYRFSVIFKNATNLYWHIEQF